MSLNERLRDYFTKRPGQWIDGRELARIAGSYGWRTRVSDLRTIYGMSIENKQHRVLRADGSSWKVSEYRYVPASKPVAQALPLGA